MCLGFGGCGMRASFFCIEVLGNGILSLVFCPDIYSTSLQQETITVAPSLPWRTVIPYIQKAIVSRKFAWRGSLLVEQYICLLFLGENKKEGKVISKCSLIVYFSFHIRYNCKISKYQQLKLKKQFTWHNWTEKCKQASISEWGVTMRKKLNSLTTCMDSFCLVVSIGICHVFWAASN